MIRTGIGYDVHALAPDRSLIIGGVQIPYAQGLAGHSDADVLLHAITDALLGALALGDMGTHFPDTDPGFKEMHSSEFIRLALGMVRDRGGRITNVDATIIAQAPTLSPWIAEMRKRIAELLELPLDSVSVKAKSHERLGTLGRGEGIAAMAVATVTLDA